MTRQLIADFILGTLFLLGFLFFLLFLWTGNPQP